MIIQRIFSDNDNRAAKDTGEAIGVAGVGALGTYGAASGVEKLAMKKAAIKEGKAAKKAYREGLDVLSKDKAAKDFGAKTKRVKAQTGSGSIFDYLWRDKTNAKLDKAYEEALSKNKESYKAGAKALKEEVKANAKKAVTKAGKVARNRWIKGGLAATGVITAGKLGNDAINRRREE